MKTWWIGAAAAAMCVAQSAMAQTPPGGGVLPDPVPVAPCPPNLDFMPGPMTSANAPPGPDTGLSLPADIPTAWGRGPVPESAAYLHLGALGLMRQDPGHGVIASLDNASRPSLTTHDLDPDYAWGVRATFGYLCDDAAIEVTGFYIPEQDTTASVAALPRPKFGQFTLPFTNLPANLPATVEANLLGPTSQGLLSRADSVTERLRSSLGDAELNYRWWSRAFTPVEGIFGFRYMNVQERASITADSTLTGNALGLGLAPASLVATDLARANNNLLLGQCGAEFNIPVTCWLYLGLMAKFAAGANYVEVTQRVSDGMGNLAISNKRDLWTYSSVYELDAFIDIVQFEKVRLRVGYNLLWVTHVAEGFQQFNSDLSQGPTIHDGGSIFYHGPMIEAMFLF
jgi:hypothetical protein